MLVNVEFNQIRRGRFTCEIIVAEEIYQYRYPYDLTESIMIIIGIIRLIIASRIYIKIVFFFLT